MHSPGDLEHFIGRGAFAFLREIALVGHDLGPVVPGAHEGDDVVVLVHGFLASAGVFRPLRAELERATGARVATFTHAPLTGVRSIAVQLERLVERIPPRTRITIVGHSLGGIVARWYVQEMGGRARVAQTVSLASPFRGLDRVPPWLVGADLHSRSPLLARLRAGADTCPVPHTSIVAADDGVVVGVDAACLGSSDVMVVPDRGHNAILFEPAVAARIIECIRRRPIAQGCAA
jgi:hypothetical protein